MKQFWQQLKKRQGLILLTLLIFGVLFSLTSRLLGKKNNATAQPTISSSSSPATVNNSTTASPVANNSPATSTTATTVDPIIQAHMQFTDYDSNEKTVYYFDFDTNRLKSYNLSTKKEQVLGELNAYVQDLRWSPNHKTVLLSLENTQGNVVPNPLYQESAEPDATVIGLYEISQRTLTPLNSSIDAFDFLTNDKIIYHYNSSGNKNISIANPDGSNWKELISFPEAATIIRAGSTALVANPTGKVTRYDATGKKLEVFDLPTNTTLATASFAGDGRNGIVTSTDTATKTLILTRLKPGAVEELVRLPVPDGDFRILWDNKTSDVYLAGYDGLMKVTTSHP